VLLHLVDAAAPTLIEDYRVIVEELEAYGAGLAAKPRVIALSKVDAMDDATMAEAAAALAQEAGQVVHCLSAATRRGVTPVLRALRREIEAARSEALGAAETVVR
jgi:GTP-binding protein